MAASSATGKGQGAAAKVTTKELSAAFNSPSILIAGLAESSVSSSPPSSSNEVVFPNAFQGGEENYIVLLTTQNGGYAYVTDMDEDSDGNFSGFSFTTESSCTLMYLVAKVGQRPVF